MTARTTIAATIKHNNKIKIIKYHKFYDSNSNHNGVW